MLAAIATMKIKTEATKGSPIPSTKAVPVKKTYRNNNYKNPDKRNNQIYAIHDLHLQLISK
jgi:hypothetical protein